MKCILHILGDERNSQIFVVPLPIRDFGSGNPGFPHHEMCRKRVLKVTLCQRKGMATVTYIYISRLGQIHHWLRLGHRQLAMENGPGMKMYFLFNMGIFQPAMLVYQRVHDTHMTTQQVKIQINHLICSKTISIHWIQLTSADCGFGHVL